MDNLPMLPILPFELILSYLNALDQHNAIIAFDYNYTRYGSFLNSKVLLALEYRFRASMISTLITSRKTYIKELNLNGIFWIPESPILNSLKQLRHLEKLYLIGTAIALDKTQFDKFEKCAKLKFLAVKEKQLVEHQVEYFTLYHRKASNVWTKILGAEIIEYSADVDYVSNVSHEWMSYFKADLNESMMPFESDKGCMKISYSDFLGDVDQVNDFFRSLRDEKILFVNNNDTPRVPNIHTGPLRHLCNLTSLHLDVHPALGKLFLKPILESCRKLKKLSIKCIKTSMSFSHMKFASPTMEDLIVYTSKSIPFNQDKFFFDLNQNKSLKLRRLNLNFGCMSPNQDLGPLKIFMKSNPQLIFLVINCTVIKRIINVMRRFLSDCKKEPHQSYHSVNLLNVLKKVPVQHYDMFNSYIFWKLYPQ